MANSKYTKEFRDSTVQLVVNSDSSVAQIARDLDIHPKTLHNWMRIYRQENNLPTDNKQSLKRSINTDFTNDEIKKLKAENKLLMQERDILKKATAYFAKETL